MYRDMGCNVKLRVHTDATAAKGIASRTGLGKTRHIAVHFLWVQEKVRNGDFKLLKVLGTNNPSDLLTKHLPIETVTKYMGFLSGGFSSGRSAVTPSI